MRELDVVNSEMIVAQEKLIQVLNSDVAKRDEIIQMQKDLIDKLFKQVGLLANHSAMTKHISDVTMDALNKFLKERA